ncbi:MAG: DUF2029 domain-containing protein [Planctomycetes bacterium]|nr:DUF2029 domain-containing protein [Planctomycetota bacterium]
MRSGEPGVARPPWWARAWRRYGPALVRTAVVVLAAVAALWLAYQTWRFFWQPLRLGSMFVHPGAVDLTFRIAEIREWFAGRPVYLGSYLAVYPPASYALLWPLVGWMEEAWVAVALWTATEALALGWLSSFAVRESGARRSRERWLLALLPLSMYATGATLGNGQVTIHVMAALLAGIGLLERGRVSWARDLLAAALFLFALVKPSVAAPFFWIVLFLPGRWRPALLVVAGYAGLTLLAAAFQEGGLPSLVNQWLARSTSTAGNRYLVTIAAGPTTVAAAVGLREFATPVSLLVLAAAGAWLYRHRRGDLWLRLAVTAILARLWTFHLWYDDLLFLLPMIALFRLLRQAAGGPPTLRVLTAGVLLALLVASNLAPGGLYSLPPPWRLVYVFVQSGVWLAVLAFLVREAALARRRTAASGSTPAPGDSGASGADVR